MLSLFPEQHVEILSNFFVKDWPQLTDAQKIAMLIAFAEGAINHRGLAIVCNEHPRDLSDALKNLETRGIFGSSGNARGKTYHISAQMQPSPEEVFKSSLISDDSSLISGKSSLISGKSSLISGKSSLISDDSSLIKEIQPDRDEFGRITHPDFDRPFAHSTSDLAPELLDELRRKASLPREKKRLQKAELEAVILDLCRDQFVTLQVLADVVSRKPNTLQSSFITEMVRTHVLRQAFPKTPNHPDQAYTTDS